MEMDSPELVKSHKQLFREEYLEARPPQQIEILKEVLYLSKNDKSLDKVGNKTKAKEAEQIGNPRRPTDLEEHSKRKPLEEKVALEILKGLYGWSLGSRVSPEEDLQKTDDLRRIFIHPPIQYRISFAKYIIKQLESRPSVTPDSHEGDGEDPVELCETLLETWYEGLEKLLSESNLHEPFYRLYEIKSGDKGREIVKIFENESSFVADGTTGLVTWKASKEFLKWFCFVKDEDGSLSSQNIPFNEVVKDRTRWVLELGCGCGLLAVAVTKSLGTTLEQYIATDGSLAALEKAELNVEENFWRDEEQPLKRKIRFEKVEWDNERTKESFGQLVDGMSCIYGNTGLLLGADVVFDPEIVPGLVNLIQGFIQAEAGNVAISSTIRNEETIRVFKNALVSANLRVKICASWENGEIIQIYSASN